jgi:hypothetical protein
MLYIPAKLKISSRATTIATMLFLTQYEENRILEKLQIKNNINLIMISYM